MSESEILMLWLPAFQFGALAAILVHDRRHLGEVLSPAEMLWRRRRITATIACVIGLGVTYAALYLRAPFAVFMTGAGVAIVGLIALLAFSFPLKAAIRLARERAAGQG